MTQQATEPEFFFDAAYPENLPRGRLVALYADGDFAVTKSQLDALQPAGVRWITVTGNGEIASILDAQPDNFLSPARIRGFVRTRRAANEDAIIYTPRSWVAEYLAILTDFGHGSLGQYAGLFWWIPTLDNTQWTAEELSADLAENWEAEIPPGRIFGNQWTQLPQLGIGAKVDVSSLFLPWRPRPAAPQFTGALSGQPADGPVPAAGGAAAATIAGAGGWPSLVGHLGLEPTPPPTSEAQAGWARDQEQPRQ